MVIIFAGTRTACQVGPAKGLPRNPVEPRALDVQILGDAVDGHHAVSVGVRSAYRDSVGWSQVDMLFVLLMRNDPRGAAVMLATGAAGAADQTTAIASFGGRVVSHYAVTGRYDAVMVAEFPSLDSCLAFGYASTANGQAVEALPALEATAMDAVQSIGADVAASQWADIETSLAASGDAAVE